MRYAFPVLPVVLAAVSIAAQGSCAELSSTFASNPLTDAGNLIQGPDSVNAATRFTWNGVDTTLTVHYDTTAPTVKLLFPLGEHFTQESSFSVSTTFKILSPGFSMPADFGGAMPSFGLVNTASTGSVRASTSDIFFTEVTQGDAYDLIGFDDFPTQDNTFGGNSVNLTTIQSPGTGPTFNSSFYFTPTSFMNDTLPLDQFITATLTYDGSLERATLNWGTGELTANLAGIVFDVDAFVIALWNDPNLTAQSPAVPAGSPVAGDVVFDSFSVQAVPEPASLAVLALGGLALLRRRGR